jgi:TM2 domain-containing membrane protein YozV
MSSNLELKSQLDTKELLLLDSEVKNNGKSMIVGYVLWYFLGLFGGHRFYTGRKGSAIAQLILTITLIGSLVTFIWWIVDAFKLHTWIKEQNEVVEANSLQEMMSRR